MAKKNVVDALSKIGPQTGGHGLKVLYTFGDQPDVLDAIVGARKRRCSFRQIALALSQDGVTISAGAVQAYLHSVGVE